MIPGDCGMPIACWLRCGLNGSPRGRSFPNHPASSAWTNPAFRPARRRHWKISNFGWNAVSIFGWRKVRFAAINVWPVGRARSQWRSDTRLNRCNTTTDTPYPVCGNGERSAKKSPWRVRRGLRVDSRVVRKRYWAVAVVASAQVPGNALIHWVIRSTPWVWTALRPSSGMRLAGSLELWR